MRIVGGPILIIFCILKKYSLIFQCYMLQNSLMLICQTYITVLLFFLNVDTCSDAKCLHKLLQYFSYVICFSLFM